MTKTIERTYDDSAYENAYKAFRLEWRRDYKALAAEIRALKTEIKNCMRQNWDASREQRVAHQKRKLATTMLRELAEAKAALKALPQASHTSRRKAA